MKNNKDVMKGSDVGIDSNLDVHYVDEEPYPSEVKTMEPVRQQTNIPSTVASNIWHQNFYRIRKKTLTIGNKYWIEDSDGHILGFCKQKILRFKEDIRIYSDEQMTDELFCIKQEQILDDWGKFAVIDIHTNTKVGWIKRKWFSNFGRDQWEIYGTDNKLIGKFYETSLGRGLARKYVPYVGLFIPEKMTLELNGQQVAEINQKFKIIGDIWEMGCEHIPENVDRRVILACIILMGTIERARKAN